MDLLPLLLHKHSFSPVMDETGRSLPRPYLWEQNALSSPRLSAHGTVNAITWWGGGEKTSDIEMNYALVTVLLEIGSDCSLQYGHSRGGSEADHQKDPDRVCCYNQVLIQSPGGAVNLQSGTQWADRKGSVQWFGASM